MTWVHVGLAAFVLAGLIFAVTLQAEAMLSRLPGVVWPVLRGACGLATLGFAAWIALAPDNTLTRTTCRIVELELHAREGGVVDVIGRLEWTSDATYTLRRPLRITRDRGTPAELYERYHDKRVPCFYRTTTPNKINLGTGEQHTREQWKKAGVVALPGLGLLVLGLVGWKRRKREGDQQRVSWLSSRGVGGTIALIAVVAGLASDRMIAIVLGIALLVLVFVRELIVASRALRYLQRKLTLARKEGKVLDTLSGERAGARIVVEERVDELAVTVTLPGWPAGVAIQRTTAPEHPIGDPVFDLEHAVSGPDATWRCLLTAPMRAAIGEAFVAETSSIDADGTWRAVYPDDIAKGPVIEEDIKRAIALGRLVAAAPAPSPERLLAIAPEEPLAKVRLGHYRWLVESGHPAPAIALITAEDPDADVRAWAASIVAPSDGAFR